MGHHEKRSRFGNSAYSIRGFTIIEIIAVLLLIGILGAIAVSRLTSATGYQIHAEADLIKAHLRYAQLRALGDADTTLGANGNTWGIAFSAGSYTLQRNGAVAPSNLPNEVSPTHTFPSGFSLTSGAGTTVTYDVWGSPGANTIAIVLSGGASPGTITITKNTGFVP